MSGPVELRPGLTPLADWRAIYRGATARLDPFARPDVDAGATALAGILARKQLQPPLKDGAPSLADLMEKGGGLSPIALVRLFVALKLGALGQGLPGMRWEVLTAIGNFLAAGLLPAIPAEGVTDRLALSYLFMALTGTGEVLGGETQLPAAKALKEAGLRPVAFSPQERCALLSGSGFSTATALAGLFEAERIFRSALIASALSAAAMHRPKAPLHPSVHRLYRQPGQREVAATLRALAGQGETGSALAVSENGAEESAGRAAPLEMGACLDLLRQAGATLERAANAVTEDRLVLWQSEEIVAGIEDRSSVTHAADLVALALRAVCRLSEARIAALANAAPAGAGASGPAASAAGFAARIRDYADGGADIRRLLPMAGTAALVIAVELIEAARLLEAEGGDLAPPLQAVLRLVRDSTGASEAGATSGLAAIAERIGSGALAEAPGLPLPGVTPHPPESSAAS